MKFEILYYSLVLILMIFGCYLIASKIKSKKINKPMRFKKNRYKDITDNIKTRFEKKEIDNIFAESGLEITSLNYEVYRHLMFLVWIIMFTYVSIINNYFNINSFIIVIIFYIISIPKVNLLGRKTPFLIIINLIKAEYEKNKNVELYRSISQLKNLAIARQDNPLGADYIIENLSRFAKLTKPAYAKALSLLRVGRKEDAIKEFGDEINTRLGKDFGKILIKLDELNPIEFKEQLEVYQNNIKNEKSTERQKKNEFISNALYAPAIASASIILMNFIVVVVFIDQMQMLKSL